METAKGYEFYPEVQDMKELPMEDPVVQANINKLKQRSQDGLRKYGHTMERDDLEPEEWINHAIEESLDFCNYLEALKRKLVRDGYQNPNDFEFRVKVVGEELSELLYDIHTEKTMVYDVMAEEVTNVSQGLTLEEDMAEIREELTTAICTLLRWYGKKGYHYQD